MEQLTVKEAIEQGYTKYGFESKEWQHLEDLHNDIFEEIDEDDFDDLVLVEKVGQAPIFSVKEMSEILSERIGENDNEQCARDSDEVYTTVAAIDYTDIVNKINKELEQHRYWMLTKIKLVK